MEDGILSFLSFFSFSFWGLGLLFRGTDTKSCSDTLLKIKEELRYKSLRWKGLRRKLKRGFLEADLV